MSEIRCIFCQWLTSWPPTELWPNRCPNCGRAGGFTAEPTPTPTTRVAPVRAQLAARRDEESR